MMSFKLSCKNIQKSFKDYSIYFMTLVFGIAIFYIFNSMDAQTSMLTLNSSKNEMVKNMVEIIGAISIFVSFILGFLIVYANNFLIRRRKKELGLYMTLGMSKGRISKLLLIETILVGVISLAVGLIVGVFASQLLSVVVAKMFEANMSEFKFVFSQAALIKTCMYFGIIYFLVMVFNIITISRYKLINLLNANKKNEKIKVKNKFVTMVLFLLSIGFIGYSYYLLKHDALTTMDNTFWVMLVSGSIGTLLFFASLSGFLLRIVQMNKKIYLKDLNMFVLRQIDSRINTNMISMSIICIMLLLTIGILSGAMSLNDSFNADLKDNNLTDVSLVNYVTLEGSEHDKDEITNLEERFKVDGFDISKYLKQYVQYNIYTFNDNSTEMSKFFLKEDVDKLKKEFGEMLNIDGMNMDFMKESEYNKLMEISGKQKLKVDLKDNEYVMVANFEKVLGAYNNSLKANKTITINGKKYVPQKNNCIVVSTQNSNMDMNFGIIVVEDAAFKNVTIKENYICGNYLAKSEDEAEKIEEQFITDMGNYYYSSKNPDGLFRPFEQTSTRILMETSSLGIKAILTFIGLYLGIIFSITSAAILAIQQLSQSSDNKERYEVLRKIGTDTKVINRSLFIQIAIFFMLPLSLALVHSVVGLSEINRLISMFGNIDLTKNIVITALFIILVYGGYFLATYLGSKSIIRENNR